MSFSRFLRKAALGCALTGLSIASAIAATARQSEPAPLPLGPARFRADIRNVKNSWDEIHDHGAATFFLARVYAELGEPQKALSLLRSCPWNEGFDPNGVGSFKALQANAEFEAIEARVHRRRPPVHRARVAFTVAARNLFPEGIAAETARPEGRAALTAMGTAICGGDTRVYRSSAARLRSSSACWAGDVWCFSARSRYFRACARSPSEACKSAYAASA